MPKIDYSKLFTRRKDGLYCATYTDKNGKRHYVYDRDPKRLHEKMQRKDDPKTVTVRQLAEAWDDEHVEKVGYKTAESYRVPLRRLVARLGDAEAETVEPADIEAILAEMKEQGYAKRTVQMQRDICNMVFKYGIRKQKTKNDPCRGVEMPSNLKTVKREIPSDDAIEAVKRGVSEPFGLFAAVCLYAGLRRGEALALQYEDIDRARHVIRVNKAVEFVGNNPHIKAPKTEAGNRETILLDVLADLLPKTGKGLIFCRDDSEPLTKTQYRKRWIAYCKAIGHDITAHQLRHGFATILYEAGIPDKDAQDLLGHSSITLTRDIYTHIRNSRKAQTLQKLNDYVSNL